MGGVPDPGVVIIPVTLAADLLGCCPSLGYQRRGLQVTDQAVVADAGIARHVPFSRSIHVFRPGKTSTRRPGTPTRARPGRDRPPGARPLMPSPARTAPANAGAAMIPSTKAPPLRSPSKPPRPTAP